MAAAMTQSFSTLPSSASSNSFTVLATSHLASTPPLVNKPSLIEYKNWRFLIHDAPTNVNIDSYIAVLKKRHCVIVVRACEATYDKQALIREGIRVVELPFSDGEAPPDHMINEWLKLCREVFDSDPHTNAQSNASNTTSSTANGTFDASTSPQHTDLSESQAPNKKTIAVHCVAGLGRAPVLVAIALIEQGLAPFDAIAYIRKKRRGAINTRQLRYIESYKPRGNYSKQHQRNNKDCAIM